MLLIMNWFLQQLGRGCSSRILFECPLNLQLCSDDNTLGMSYVDPMQMMLRSKDPSFWQKTIGGSR